MIRKSDPDSVCL